MWKITLICLSIIILPLNTNAQTYGDNFFIDGSCSVNTYFSGSYICDYAVDQNLGTGWLAEPVSLPNWFQYDLGTSTQKILGKITITPQNDAGGSGLKAFSVYGSEDLSTWTLVLATTSDYANDGTDKTATTTPAEDYRYFRLWFPNTWRPSNQTWLLEIEAYEQQNDTIISTSTGFMSTTTDAFVGFTFQVIGWFLILGFIFLCAWITFKAIKK